MALLAMLGAVAVVLTLYGHGVWRGYWGEFVTVLQRNLSYGAIDRVPLRASMFEAARTSSRILLQNTAAPVLAIISVWACFRAHGAMRKTERKWLTIALLWLAAAVASAFPGGRHYDHYYHLCWAPVSLVSTMWLTVLSKRPGNRRPRFTSALSWGLALGVVVISVLFNIQLAVKATRDLREGTHRWSAIEKAVAYLNRTAPPAVPVVMNLWGDWAELYWRSPRPAPSLPIPHVVPTDRYSEWVDATLANPPRLIVTDGTPWRPIDGPGDADDLERLRRLIDAEYREVQRINGLIVLARK
jgi:hypothetical protein